MFQCPNCGSEYDEGTQKCPECGYDPVKLKEDAAEEVDEAVEVKAADVAEASDAEKGSAGLENREAGPDGKDTGEAGVEPDGGDDTSDGITWQEDKEAFLVTAGDYFEANILETKLKAYGIPVLKKYKNYGDYLNVFMGSSPFGIDLYVPSKMLDKARDLTPGGITEQDEQTGSMAGMGNSLGEVIDNNNEADNGIETETGSETEDGSIYQSGSIPDIATASDSNKERPYGRRISAWIMLAVVVPSMILLVYILLQYLMK